MKKLVVVINGAGGVGKDTMCAFAARRFRVRNISSVDPIKAMARLGGWDGDKSDKSRKMLSDLKQLFTAYNDLPLKYILEQYTAFLAGEEQVMFVHIREPQEISRFVARAPEHVRTLLITNSKKEKRVYRNASDDSVEDYRYDAVFDNCNPLEETEENFLDFFGTWFAEQAFEA